MTARGPGRPFGYPPCELMTALLLALVAALFVTLANVGRPYTAWTAAGTLAFIGWCLLWSPASGLALAVGAGVLGRADRHHRGGGQHPHPLTDHLRSGRNPVPPAPSGTSAASSATPCAPACWA
jgi:hypothetical protein